MATRWLDPRCFAYLVSASTAVHENVTRLSLLERFLERLNETEAPLFNPEQIQLTIGDGDDLNLELLQEIHEFSLSRAEELSRFLTPSPFQGLTTPQAIRQLRLLARHVFRLIEERRGEDDSIIVSDEPLCDVYVA